MTWKSTSHASTDSCTVTSSVPTLTRLYACAVEASTVVIEVDSCTGELPKATRAGGYCFCRAFTRVVTAATSDSRRWSGATG